MTRSYAFSERSIPTTRSFRSWSIALHPSSRQSMRAPGQRVQQKGLEGEGLRVRSLLLTFAHHKIWSGFEISRCLTCLSC